MNRLRSKLRYTNSAVGVWTVMAIIGLAALISEDMQPLSWWQILRMFALGGGVGMFFSSALHAYETRRIDAIRNETFSSMPRSIERHENEDGTDTLIVVRNSGEITTLVTPEGYHPHDDGGRWVVEQLLPEEYRSLLDVESSRYHDDDDE